CVFVALSYSTILPTYCQLLFSSIIFFHFPCLLFLTGIRKLGFRDTRPSDTKPSMAVSNLERPVRVTASDRLVSLVPPEAYAFLLVSEKTLQQVKRSS
ncbi:hypothetical protein, partial [Desulfosporosinus metallidurans]|uniref:hypothetical protein n=1 Tax=Desulfosporosinus metallidurans TaxID=1888891 RepID=UPI001A9A3D63